MNLQRIDTEITISFQKTTFMFFFFISSKLSEMDLDHSVIFQQIIISVSY